MKLYIKNMVSQRCTMKVKEELKKAGIGYVEVDLGVAEIVPNLSVSQRERLKIVLHKSGLELLDDKRKILVERIKNVITIMIHRSEELPRMNYSDYISKELALDYTYLANTFSEVTGITIQHFIIINKIELVKELLSYGDLSLTEIAYRLHYSSVSHLSNQFKSITGYTPTNYNRSSDNPRTNLENV